MSVTLSKHEAVYDRDYVESLEMQLAQIKEEFATERDRLEDIYQKDQEYPDDATESGDFIDGAVQALDWTINRLVLRLK